MVFKPKYLNMNINLLSIDLPDDIKILNFLPDGFKWNTLYNNKHSHTDKWSVVNLEEKQVVIPVGVLERSALLLMKLKNAQYKTENGTVTIEFNEIQLPKQCYRIMSAYFNKKLKGKLNI